MTNRLNLNERLKQLQQFNTELRQQLEAAEACIPPINDAIEQLARVGLVHDQAFLGPIVYERGYSDRTGPHTSGQVLQSALLVPGGLGIVLWDSEEYLAFVNSPAPPGSDLFPRFVRFEDCPLGVKALLMLHVRDLFERLYRMVMPPQG